MLFKTTTYIYSGKWEKLTESHKKREIEMRFTWRKWVRRFFFVVWTNASKLSSFFFSYISFISFYSFEQLFTTCCDFCCTLEILAFVLTIVTCQFEHSQIIEVMCNEKYNRNPNSFFHSLKNILPHWKQTLLDDERSRIDKNFMWKK